MCLHVSSSALPIYDMLQLTGEFPGYSCLDSDREVI
jgi:hypothetical protein